MTDELVEQVLSVIVFDGDLHLQERSLREYYTIEFIKKLIEE